MPDVTLRQHGFMEMSKTAAGRRKLKAHGKKPAPVAVAKEFTHADKGKHFGHAAKRARAHSSGY